MASGWRERWSARGGPASQRAEFKSTENRCAAIYGNAPRGGPQPFRDRRSASGDRPCCSARPHLTDEAPALSPHPSPDGLTPLTVDFRKSITRAVLDRPVVLRRLPFAALR